MIEDEMRKLAASQIIRQMGRLKANIEAGTMLSEEEQEALLKVEEEQYRVKTFYAEDAQGNVTSEVPAN
jgi:LPS-assembly lipoprotein